MDEHKHQQERLREAACLIRAWAMTFFVVCRDTRLRVRADHHEATAVLFPRVAHSSLVQELH